MLVEFKVGNFLSFKDEKNFSMVSHTIKEHEQENTILDPSEKNRLLKSHVLYGANGSGKSNLLTAMRFFQYFVQSSSIGQITDEIEVMPFQFSSETENEASFFEITFFIDDIRYRYGFEADNQKVHIEYLFSLKSSSKKETKLFTREFQEIIPNKKSFKEGKNIEDKTRPNALFLSTVAQFNGKIATQILAYFHQNIRIISGIDDDNYIGFTIEKFQAEKQFRMQLIEFFKSIKIGFENVEINEEETILEDIQHILDQPELKEIEIPTDVKEILNDLQNLHHKVRKFNQTNEKSRSSISINFLHRKFDEAEKELDFVALDLGLQSKGTQKLFNLFGLWIDAIENDKVLIIDELDARLHTLLTMELIKFFHSKANEKAQLIFASHDTNLLKKELFRRDQISFTEKDEFGATDLYSLVEYTINQAKVRNDASFEKDYLLGKYGAIPFLGDIKQFITSYLDEQV